MGVVLAGERLERRLPPHPVAAAHVTAIVALGHRVDYPRDVADGREGHVRVTKRTKGPLYRGLGAVHQLQHQLPLCRQRVRRGTEDGLDGGGEVGG